MSLLQYMGLTLIKLKGMHNGIERAIALHEPPSVSANSVKACYQFEVIHSAKGKTKWVGGRTPITQHTSPFVTAP